MRELLLRGRVAKWDDYIDTLARRGLEELREESSKARQAVRKVTRRQKLAPR